MQTEVEAKFLHQDHAVIRKILQKNGAQLIQPMKLMRRTVFDFPDRRLLKKRAWVRLREELDGSVELMLKQVVSDDIGQTFEQPIKVSDYEAAKMFVTSLGLEIKGEQESKRELWKLGEVEIMLDEWPWADPFIEIEASNEAEVKAVAKKLDLKWESARFGGITPVYTEQYNISAAVFEKTDLSMKFSQPVPEVLLNAGKI